MLLNSINRFDYRQGPDEAPQTSFYQWVVFMMVLQAALFYLPYKVHNSYVQQSSKITFSCPKWIHIQPLHQVWFFLEGGLIGNFGRDGKAPVSWPKLKTAFVFPALLDQDLISNQVMISVECRYDDGVVMEAVVEKFVKYFKSIFHHNTWYFVYFVTCRSFHCIPY